MRVRYVNNSRLLLPETLGEQLRRVRAGGPAVPIEGSWDAHIAGAATTALLRRIEREIERGAMRASVSVNWAKDALGQLPLIWLRTAKPLTIEQVSALVGRPVTREEVASPSGITLPFPCELSPDGKQQRNMRTPRLLLSLAQPPKFDKLDHTLHGAVAFAVGGYDATVASFGRGVGHALSTTFHEMFFHCAMMTGSIVFLGAFVDMIPLWAGIAAVGGAVLCGHAAMGAGLTLGTETSSVHERWALIEPTTTGTRLAEASRLVGNACRWLYFHLGYATGWLLGGAFTGGVRREQAARDRTNESAVRAERDAMNSPTFVRRKS